LGNVKRRRHCWVSVTRWLVFCTRARPRLMRLRGYGVGVGLDVRGVALLDRLITSGTSPLYGSQVGPLRDELGRIRNLLGSAS
jgi:hypothetical protein